MYEELAFLRAIAANPYDRVRLSAYADWLYEHDRDEEAVVVQAHSAATVSSVSGNSVTVGELIAHLLTMPLDAPVIYRAMSDWTELRADEVRLVRPEDQVVARRSGHGFYDHHYYTTDPEPPNYVTAVCFPGN